MPYYRNIPGAAQRISASQPQLQTNTNTVDDSFNQDHVHHAATWEGKHADVHLTNFAAEPAANTQATDIEIFNFTSALTANPELFVRKGVAAHGIPFTAKGGAFDYNVLGTVSWSYLPSGVLFKCGRIAGTAGGVVVNLQPAGEPAYTTRPLVICTVADNAPHGYEVYAYNVNLADFSVRIHGATAATNVDWVTIGV